MAITRIKPREERFPARETTDSGGPDGGACLSMQGPQTLFGVAGLSAGRCEAGKVGKR